MIWPHGDPAAIVRSVLEQPAYRAVRPSTAAAPQPTLLELAWRWLFSHVLAPLVHPIARVLGASHGVGTAIGLALAALALLALGYVVFKLTLAFVRSARPSPGETVEPGESSGRRRSAHDWLRAARRAAECGDEARAIAALFSAALATLDERALVPFDATRTPGEYRRAVRRVRSAAAPAFDELSDRFVRAAYAGELPAAGEFERAERAYSAFEPAARVS